MLASQVACPNAYFSTRNGLMDGFTKRHGLHRLIWYERHQSMATAIRRETSLKKYPRDWKTNLIERENRYWEDLYYDMIGERRLKKAVEALSRNASAPN